MRYTIKSRETGADLVKGDTYNSKQHARNVLTRHARSVAKFWGYRLITPNQVRSSFIIEEI